jgi:hypothetical protein
MAEGEFALVRKYLEVALGKTSVLFGEHDLYAMLVDAAAQQRDAAAVKKYAPLAEELAGRHDHKLYQAIAHRAWGVAHQLEGQYAESEVRLKRALELFETLDMRWQIGRTLYELGELARSHGEDEAARGYFTRGLAAFEAMGAAPDARRVQEKLAAL